ncbi:MAG TPA: GNAT family N-acetyltransferase [Acidobacteriaceae bacterium]|nr:GNAT family N-acetyltransferase [Acidobacteriaceae bacterium]
MPTQNELPLTIRAIESRDADAVSGLVSQLGYHRAVPEIADWIDCMNGAAQQAAFVACRDNKVVGWIEVSIERRLQTAPFALIGGLVVADGVRGQGIGRLLCQAAEDWARGRGLEKLRVTSRSTRTDAHRFYLRDGYEAVKTSMVFEKNLR